MTNFINEANVDGLKDVKTIRHYTTGKGLASILDKGYIQAKISKGDSEWDDYAIIDSKVVSFHDVRTDPEWKYINKANEKRCSLEDVGTHTLGLHMDKVCACIEIDYEKIDKLIQDRTHLLNIYDKKAEDFCNLWNNTVEESYVKDKRNSNICKKCELDILLFLINTIEGKDKKLLDSVKYIWDNAKNWKHDILFNYNSITAEKIFENDEGQLAFKEIEKILLNYFTKKELYSKTYYEYYSYSAKVDLIYSIIYECFIYDKFPNKYGIDKIKEKIERLDHNINFYERTNLKKFTDEEILDLSEACIKFDIVSIIKMMRHHGWKHGDSIVSAFGIRTNRRLLNDPSGKFLDGTLLFWIDDLLENSDKIVNADIEIRIPSNVKINKNNCTIYIFDGIVSATKQDSLISEIDNYWYKTYDIVHVKP